MVDNVVELLMLSFSYKFPPLDEWMNSVRNKYPLNPGHLFAAHIVETTSNGILEKHLVVIEKKMEGFISFYILGVH